MAEFIIPLSFEDLRSLRSSNQYYVKTVIDASTITSQIDAFTTRLLERSPECLYKYFDYFYGVLDGWNQLSIKLKDKVWDMLLRNCAKWSAKFIAMNNNDENQSLYRNCVKMNVYLIYKFMEMYESKMQQDVVIEKSKSRKKKAQAAGVTNLRWIEEITEVVNVLNELLKTPIEKLWSPPVVETDFVNLLSNCCYKLMENVEYCKNMSIRLAMVEILFKLNKFHNHSSDSSIKLGQLLQTYPHFGAYLQYICSNFINNNLNSVVRDILMEICSYSSSDLEHNSQASSNFAGFLSEFGTQYPNEIVALLPVLIDKLEEEPYNMRNCILTILGEIVIQVYHDDAQNRDSLLDAIEGHMTETNGFVRAKVLSVLANIVDHDQIMTIERKNNLMKQLIGENGALFDTLGTVRKNAIKILVSCVQQNFAKGLTEDDLLEDLRIAKEEYEVSERNYKNIMEEKESEFVQSKIEKLESSDDVNIELEAQTAIESLEGKKQELLKQRDLKRGALVILEQSIEYVRLLNSAVMDMTYLLNSKTSSDVLEAISFFVDAKINKIPNVDAGVRKMLLHISSKEKSIQSAMADAYKRLYLTSDEDNMKQFDQQQQQRNTKKLFAIQTVNRLSGLIPNATEGELISLQLLIAHFAENGEIDENIVDCMWKRFMSKTDPIDLRWRRYAAVLFSMVSSIYMPFMKNYLNFFIHEELSLDWLKTLDFKLIGYLCITIQNLANVQEKNKKPEPFRLSSDHSLFRNLINVCTDTFDWKNKPNWIFMSQEIINTIYQLSENPDSLASKLIQKLTTATFQTDKENLQITDNNNNNNNDNDNNEHPDVNINNGISENVNAIDLTRTATIRNNKYFNIRVDCTLLTRFIGVIGHIIIRQFTHFEVAILTELNRRNAEQEAKMNKENKQISKVQRKPGQNTIHDNSVASTNNLEDEMGMVGATADDGESEFILWLCENHLVTEPSLLFNRLVRIIAWVCSPRGGRAADVAFRAEAIQTQASLALSKAMLVSESVCLKHIELLFRLAQDPNISPPSTRANLMVALGDLVRRFTNALEPYTSLLYARLSDPSVRVRNSALNVISHLVLNDMIKVKGQISEMTKCLVDSSCPRIVHLSKVFFQELANKDKALYNVIPDIISNLSVPEMGVNEEDFCTIMEFLMPFIQKKNQNENLFEKICARFDPNGHETTWKNLMYCLSLLTYNENMVQSLQFRLNSFAGMLHVNAVYDSLCNILQSIRKTIRSESSEAKTTLDEMTVKIEELRSKGVEDEEAQMNAAQAANPRRRGGAHSQRKSVGRQRRTQQLKSKSSNEESIFSEESENSVEDYSNNDKAAVPATTSQSATRSVNESFVSTRSLRSNKQKRLRVVDSSSNSSNSDV